MKRFLLGILTGLAIGEVASIAYLRWRKIGVDKLWEAIISAANAENESSQTDTKDGSTPKPTNTSATKAATGSQHRSSPL